MLSEERKLLSMATKLAEKKTMFLESMQYTLRFATMLKSLSVPRRRWVIAIRKVLLRLTVKRIRVLVDRYELSLKRAPMKQSSEAAAMVTLNIVPKSNSSTHDMPSARREALRNSLEQAIGDVNALMQQAQLTPTKMSPRSPRPLSPLQRSVGTAGTSPAIKVSSSTSMLPAMTVAYPSTNPENSTTTNLTGKRHVTASNKVVSQSLVHLPSISSLAGGAGPTSSSSSLLSSKQRRNTSIV